MNNSKHFNNTLFESLSVGLALTRMDGTLVEINPAFAKIIGRTPDEICKLSYWDITPVEYHEQEKNSYKIYMTLENMVLMKRNIFMPMDIAYQFDYKVGLSSIMVKI